MYIRIYVYESKLWAPRYPTMPYNSSYNSRLMDDYSPNMVVIGFDPPTHIYIKGKQGNLNTRKPYVKHLNHTLRGPPGPPGPRRATTPQGHLAYQTPRPPGLGLSGPTYLPTYLHTYIPTYLHTCIHS